MDDTPLLVNIKGCGYPPEIACALFASRYNGKSNQLYNLVIKVLNWDCYFNIILPVLATWYKHETFPCYYSKVNPWIVLETYNPRCVSCPSFRVHPLFLENIHNYFPYIFKWCHNSSHDCRIISYSPDTKTNSEITNLNL